MRWFWQENKLFLAKGISENGGPNGDLHVTVTVRPDPIFKLNGFNIFNILKFVTNKNLNN